MRVISRAIIRLQTTEAPMKLYQIDAFTHAVFSGNPAAVVPLTQWLDDSLLLAIAAENNLSETAFIVPSSCANSAEADPQSDYQIRWFTPTVEVDLCGHATLAAAWVAFNELDFTGDVLHFDSVSGPLYVRQLGARLELDFPARAPNTITPPALLAEALQVDHQNIRAVLQARDTLVVLNNESAVQQLAPDFALLNQIDTFAVVATAPGNECDFVSRFFAPRRGINEDPVTGSAHCSLAPYWAKALGRSTLVARQLSARGGTLYCTINADRVLIAGEARCYLRGDISLPDRAN